jgi:hypothetical protein
MSVTVSQLLNLALKDAGVVGQGQPATGEDINDAFTLANFMLSEWAVQRWFIWHLVEYYIQSTGQQSYTVGPTGNIVTPYVPNTIDDAFLRQIISAAPNQVDFPLKIITAREDYDRIALKQLGSFARYAFYDYSAENGTGTLYPWPVPLASIYEIHILIKAQLANFTGLTQTITLPAQYQSALHYNLAKRFRAHWDLPESEATNKLARSTINVVKGANLQVPTLQIPVELTRNAIYDIYSDQVY